MRVVEVGQYFVTKDTGNLRQFRFSGLSRIHSSSRRSSFTRQEGWIQGNMRVDSNQDNTEVPADPQEDQVPQTSIKVVAARSKAKAKPQPRELVGPDTCFMVVYQCHCHLQCFDAPPLFVACLNTSFLLPCCLCSDPASEPKGWIQGNMRIGPVLEVTTSLKHFKYGIEIRIESMNKDICHSWVRISYGTVKYVVDSIQDNTENPADSQEEESLQTSSSVVAARSKAKAKPQPRDSTGITTIPLRERRWIDIEPSKQNLASYDLSKKVINLLRHNQKLHREEDGAIQFYKIKFSSPRSFFTSTELVR